MSQRPRRPQIIWLRRDLRLVDNPAIHGAAQTGDPVIFVFIRDQQVDDMGAAAKWRLGLSLADLQKRLSQKGCSLIFKSGAAEPILKELIAQNNAAGLHYCRDYTPLSIARDTSIKSALKSQIEVTSYQGQLLFEPWSVQNGSGSFYKVYTPFWKAVRDRSIGAPILEPDRLNPAPSITESEKLADWKLGAAMNRGAYVVQDHICVGEQAAQNRLSTFCELAISDYKAQRDRMDFDATSRLSENLTYGEISPRQMWVAGQAALQRGAAGAEHFLKEIAWREFAYHLIYHTPHITHQNWREGWGAFPWQPDNEDAERWRRGMTGEPIVDAAMREMYVTGTMHNRARMIVASYLTKHLMVHWKVGMDWFAECLTDWDPASNAMGWQWTAGCGPDASPFFRIFNPQTQAEKFDPNQVYQDRFLDVKNPEAASFYEAIPASWALSPEAAPEKMIELKVGRERALAAYKTYTTDGRENAAQKQEEQA